MQVTKLMGEEYKEMYPTPADLKGASEFAGDTNTKMAF